MANERQQGIGWLQSQAISSMREAVMVTDANLSAPGPTILFVNHAFCRMTGHAAEDVVGQSPRMLQGPATDRETLARLKQRLDAGMPFEGRVINYRKDGRPYMLEWYIEPALDREGTISHFVAVQRDVTGQDSRDASLGYLNAAFEHAEDPVVVLSGIGLVKYENAVSRKVFAGQVRLPADAWSQMREQGSWAGRLQLEVGGDLRAFDTKIRAVPDVYPGERNYVLLASDVTDVERLESIASSVNLSDNLGHFVSGIRHELGNPTNSIKTALTVLRSNLHTFPTEKIDQYLEQVLAEVARIEHLLRSLRSYSAHESMQLGYVELGPMFERLGKLLTTSMQRSAVALEIDPAPQGVIFVDERAIYQVFINLVSNALEAVEGSKGAQIRIAFATTLEHVEIMLIDNGPGVSDSQIRKMRQPFYTTKRTGTGLGLSIVEKLLSAVDGSLSIDNIPDGGTVATVRLPLSMQEIPR